MIWNKLLFEFGETVKLFFQAVSATWMTFCTAPPPRWPGWPGSRWTRSLTGKLPIGNNFFHKLLYINCGVFPSQDGPWRRGSGQEVRERSKETQEEQLPLQQQQVYPVKQNPKILNSVWFFWKNWLFVGGRITITTNTANITEGPSTLSIQAGQRQTW